ncbi:MAG TPA: acetate--CoA ligase family protein, partial [Syntrophorhabdaceae bacterium]|nr:acetate--CoA ligase family protein [Syntrophorhabdaceae bacterium]
KKLDGIIVQQDGKGFEVIVGVSNDAQFGPILMFGPGGIFVEAIRDVSFRLIPIKPFDARDMIVELKNYPALKNPRNGTTDLAAVEQLLCRISKYVTDHPEIQEIDLNPVFVLSRGVSICDARISLSKNPTAEP